MRTNEQMRADGWSETEIQRATCVHEFGEWEDRTFMGCTRRCRKCSMMQCDPNHCGQYDARTK